MTLLATLDHADADLTACLARVMAAVLKPGDVIALQGAVGAGKTHFARAFIRARQGAAAEDVPSPTFTIVQTYETAPPIAHFDLYRLEGQGEALEIGLEEALDQGAAIVEWPVRISQREWARLAPDQLALELSHAGEGRIARLTPQGRWKGRRLEF